METISVSTVKKRKLNYDEPSTSSSELKQKKTCRKYCPEYLQIGFTWSGDEENPRPQCVICGCILANESMRPNKLHRHIDTNHPEIKVQENYPTVSNEAVKMLLPFISSYNCEVGFSAMVAIKTKLRSKLKLSNSLRLKLTNAEVDIDDVMKKNRKQLHPSH
eukprot:XP_008186777.1 PREDICTED: zinc finger BED domain-containing protein 5-like [Acyrthosiphon pisum]